MSEGEGESAKVIIFLIPFSLLLKNLTVGNSSDSVFGWE